MSAPGRHRPLPRIQTKILGALSALVVTVVFATGLLAERGLHAQVVGDIERALSENARLVGLQIAEIPFDPEHAPQLDRIVSAAAAATLARVTLIAPDGRVLADSDLTHDEVRALENHGARDEVVAALSGETGRSIRLSQSVGRPLIYVAVPVRTDGSGEVPGVIRLALGLDRADQAVTALRRELIFAGVLAIIASLGLAYGLSVLSLRPIRELAEVVSDIASGQLGRQLHWEASDERGAIARSINRMAEQMQHQIGIAESDKAQLDSVLASMVEGVLVIDVDGRIVLANPRLREMFSIWGPVEGRRLPEVFRDPEVDRAFGEASRGDDDLREFEIRRPHDRILLMNAARFPREGSREGMVFVLHDVTDVRRVDEVRRDFVANASHELRTPLTAIQGFADTLATGRVEAEQQRIYLDVISRNAQRMADLIDDLLALSRIESDGHVLDLTPVDVGRIAEMTVSDFTPRFTQAGLTASVRVDRPALARADHRAVEEIMDNLLSNAARYTNEGGHIEVGVTSHGDSVEISVSDDGIGIPEHALDRIFERFYRVDAARSRALGSTGLGLAIVKHLVAKMDGAIEVSSEVGRGSRFAISLPAANA